VRFLEIWPPNPTEMLPSEVIENGIMGLSGEVTATRTAQQRFLTT
jgi:hypothetical protein